VRCVDDDVGVGRIVDRGDLAVADTKCLVHDLLYGGEAIGGAGGRRQEAMFGRVVTVVVDPDHDI
jgi:hypothetical protein